jgi:hypothetical protein
MKLRFLYDTDAIVKVNDTKCSSRIITARKDAGSDDGGSKDL